MTGRQIDDFAGGSGSAAVVSNAGSAAEHAMVQSAKALLLWSAGVWSGQCSIGIPAIVWL